MRKPAWLTFDIGTSAVKAALIGVDGAALAEARSPVGLYRGADEREYESEPREWLAALAAASKAVLRGAGPTEILALSTSGNGPTLVPCDAAGEPVGRALSWMDRRARDEALTVGELAGLPLDPSFYLPKALWLRERDPERFSRVGRFFACPEWVAFRLSGVAESWLADPYYERYTWALDAAGKLGFDGALFPPYAPSSRVMGKLLPAAAAALGLPEGVPIVSSWPDFLASLVGSGAVRPGVACDRSGTSEALNLCAGRPFPDFTLLSLPHAVPGLWNLSGGLSTSGKALEWFADSAGYGDEGAPGVIAEARRARPGASGLIFLPYLAGERAPLWNRDLRGAFLGLAQGHGRRELARAVAESIAYGLRLSHERMAAAGFPTEVARTSGSAARDDFMNALKADVLGVPFERPELADAELLGGACACAVALGEADGLAEASDRMARVAARFEPDASLRPRYDELFLAYREALEAIAPVSARLASSAARFEAQDREASGDGNPAPGGSGA